VKSLRHTTHGGQMMISAFGSGELKREREKPMIETNNLKIVFQVTTEALKLF